MGGAEHLIRSMKRPQLQKRALRFERRGTNVLQTSSFEIAGDEMQRQMPPPQCTRDHLVFGMKVAHAVGARR